jgi:hypothetical protein
MTDEFPFGTLEHSAHHTGIDIIWRRAYRPHIVYGDFIFDSA